MFKHDSNSWFSGPYPFSKRRTPVCFDAWGKGQLDIVELATCFLELGDSEAALGTLPLSSLVYITRTEIGFFGIFTIFLVDWEHILLMGLMWLVLSSLDLPQDMLEPSEATMAAIGGIAGRNWLTISCDGLLSKSNYTYFVTKSKHSASFPSFLSCIEFRFRRTAWCTPGTTKQQTEFIFSTCIAKYVSLVFAVVHCFPIFFSWIKVKKMFARVFLPTE